MPKPDVFVTPATLSANRTDLSPYSQQVKNRRGAPQVRDNGRPGVGKKRDVSDSLNVRSIPTLRRRSEYRDDRCYTDVVSAVVVRWAAAAAVSARVSSIYRAHTITRCVRLYHSAPVTPTLIALLSAEALFPNVLGRIAVLRR